ncbi:MAG: hypothetical protein ACFFED_08360 [Candidatus Thorarchaeota archaeon]
MVKKMLRSKKAIGSIITVLFTLLLVIHPEIVPWYSNNKLEWGLEIGNKLTYNVTYANYTSLSQTYIDYGWIGLNNTPIVFEITVLPSVPRVIQADNFEEEVILVKKVECYSLNGDPLPMGSATVLMSLVSQSILPINDSSMLDSLYPDYDFEYHGTLPRGPQFFIQEDSEDGFLIGHMSLTFFTYGHGGYGTGWYATLMKETGYPEYIELTSFAPMSTGCVRDESITFVLIGFESI